MIVYGTNSTHLASEQPEHLTCPNCESKGSVTLTIFRTHFHIFWIPLFPTHKNGGAVCQECGHQMKRKQMPDDMKQEYDDLKAVSKGPIWQFAGLGLIALLIVVGYFSSMQASKEEQAYLEAPQVGDVYELESANGNYTTMKLQVVSDDSLYFNPNEYETNKITGLSDIDREDYYADWIVAFDRASILQMHEDGDIVGIER